MDIRFAADAEITTWDAKVLSNPDGGNVFQGEEFADQKKMSGWTPRFLVAGNLAITVLEKSVFGLGKFWYIPKGPGVSDETQLDGLLPELKKFANKQGVFAVKIEPEILKTNASITHLIESGLLPVTPIQPNFSTVLLDLSPNAETIIANLNQTSRHAIRRAEREGVTVEEVEADNVSCQKFYEMLSDTAAGSFHIRPYDYYYKFWRRYADAGLGQLFFAYHNDKLIAGAFAMVFGEKSTYKDGASVREKTVYGASHLLQLYVMQWAKRQGSKKHDLCGSPPNDQIGNKNHPHYGIGLFKTSFNKQVTDYVGAFDLVVKPTKYKWWKRIGESLTKRRWWRKHHESWY